uniref:Uncharacterized protein n=1 Tax=uncultured Thiotrichaceae bacterium TaxID=298394 RepID=A0A6S6SIL2_9GAMM|nr:MAG: Unknown protein [uncultured Thiotrichaceae bacterium]
MIRKASCTLLLWTVLFYQTVLAIDDVPLDLDLLEFLGTIAGLESMGVDIDLILDDPESTEVVVENNGEDNE